MISMLINQQFERPPKKRVLRGGQSSNPNGVNKFSVPWIKAQKLHGLSLALSTVWETNYFADTSNFRIIGLLFFDS